MHVLWSKIEYKVTINKVFGTFKKMNFRFKKYLTKFAIIFPLLCASLLVFTFQTAYAQNLRIYHIDVEQGDATLFISPTGTTMLVDSGGNGRGSRTKAVMQDAGVSRIDHFVCTHYHDDHYGGIDELADDSEVTIGKMYDRGDKNFIPKSKRDGARFPEYETTVGHNAIQLQRGKKIRFANNISVTSIAMGGVVISERNADTGINENDMSIALLIEYGDFKYFIGGDIEHPTEDEIAERGLVMDVDVYHSNHHGSDSSSTPALMEDMKPTVIVISNGNHGGYKHPRKSTLTYYKSMSPEPTVFQTNKYLKNDGKGGNVPDEYIADPETISDTGTILLSVDKTKGTYEVSYRNLSHKFQIKKDGN